MGNSGNVELHTPSDPSLDRSRLNHLYILRLNLMKPSLYSQEIILKRAADLVETAYAVRGPSSQYLPSPLPMTSMTDMKSPVIYGTGASPGYQVHYNMAANNNNRNSRDEPMQTDNYMEGGFVNYNLDNDNERHSKKRQRDNTRPNLTVPLPHVNSFTSSVATPSYQQPSIRSATGIYGAPMQVMPQSAGYMTSQGS